ncbi:MAG: hypothetical protein J0H68_03520 [Sphingobacteriia bacterium]|nr:hypothetical protein [Sphingobacteriia bacterium]
MKNNKTAIIVGEMHYDIENSTVFASQLENLKGKGFERVYFENHDRFDSLELYEQNYLKNSSLVNPLEELKKISIDDPAYVKLNTEFLSKGYENVSKEIRESDIEFQKSVVDRLQYTSLLTVKNVVEKLKDLDMTVELKIDSNHNLAEEFEKRQGKAQNLLGEIYAIISPTKIFNNFTAIFQPDFLKKIEESKALSDKEFETLKYKLNELQSIIQDPNAMSEEELIHVRDKFMANEILKKSNGENVIVKVGGLHSSGIAKHLSNEGYNVISIFPYGKTTLECWKAAKILNDPKAEIMTQIIEEKGVIIKNENGTVITKDAFFIEGNEGGKEFMKLVEQGMETIQAQSRSEEKTGNEIDDISSKLKSVQLGSSGSFASRIASSNNEPGLGRK